MGSFYFDEGGHSGDLVGTATTLDFGGQPVFSLACVGITDEEQLARKFAALKAKYRIKGGELKSTGLRNIPAAITDLAEWLIAESIPYFLEIADKKFFIGTCIVNSHIVPPHHRVGFDRSARVLRNQCADLLAECAPDSVYVEFTSACLKPSPAAVRRSFDTLLSWLERERLVNLRAGSILEITAASRSIFEVLQSQRETAYLEFLPIPDKTKSQKDCWILPNLSAFCNIYARINKYLGGDISEVRLIHDEQSHLDEVLIRMKESLESRSEYSAGAFTPAANYVFNQSAALQFAKSQESLGVQLADLLAGSATRYYKAMLGGRNVVDSELRRAMRALIVASNAATGVGVNLVVPTAKAGVTLV